jgi:perosamine synthetase
MIPYGRQHIDDDDIQAVVEVLHSTWLTTGPKVKEFEEAFARHTGTKHAVAVSNGTAALHAAMYALNIGPGDEVIVPAITFVATANAVVYQGATPVFADVDPENLLINTERIEEWITSKTRAIIAVDYAGHPCNYDELRDIAKRHDLYLVDDA